MERLAKEVFGRLGNCVDRYNVTGLSVDVRAYKEDRQIRNKSLNRADGNHPSCSRSESTFHDLDDAEGSVAIYDGANSLGITSIDENRLDRIGKGILECAAIKYCCSTNILALAEVGRQEETN